MSYDELSDFISRAESAGYSRSKSKELGKAEDLRKTLQPSKYGEETVANAKTKLMSSTTPETQQKLGIAPAGASGTASLLGNTGTSSAPDLNQLYNSAMNDPALKALEEELDQKKRARDTELAKINDNPYYAEARRVGKIDKLEQKAGNEINTLSASIAEKKADAQVKINIATQQYNIDSQEYKRNMEQFNNLISTGAILGASSQDIAQIALGTGMSTAMVKSVIETARKGQQQLQMATDDNGNVTIFDARSGEIINTIDGIGNAQKSGGTQSNDIAMQKAFESSIESGINQLEKGESWGSVWSRVKQLYPDIPDAIIDNLLGVEWRTGGAYESWRAKQESTKVAQ